MAVGAIRDRGGGAEILAATDVENVVYRTRLHWIIFAPPLLLFAAGLGAVAFQPVTAVVLLAASAAAILAAYAKYASTEIVITDQRIVYKSGLLARKTVEMRKDKIESIDVSESVFGRLLDFGSVTVKGTGGGIEAIHNVAAPFELRHHVADGGTEEALPPRVTEPLRS